MADVRSVSIRVHRRKGDTAIENFQIGLKFQHEVTLGGGWDSLGESYYVIVGDDGTGLEG